MSNMLPSKEYWLKEFKGVVNYMNIKLSKIWENCLHYNYNHYCNGDCPHYNNGICELHWDYPYIFPLQCGDFRRPDKNENL